MADPHGVSVAFAADALDPDPAWTRLDTIDALNVQSWTIDRGRTSEFDKTGTGTATIQIIDKAGLLDPTNSSSPYWGLIEPHKQAAIALQDPVAETWHTLFRGFVEDWTFELPPAKNHLVVGMHLVDGFGVLATQELQAGSDGASGYPGNVVYPNTDNVKERLDAICDDVGWPEKLRDLFEGNVELAPKSYGPSGTSALAALQDAADGEYPGLAQLMMSKAGLLTFRGRQPRFRPDVAEYGINERDVGDVTLDPTLAPISAIAWNRSTANIRNAVSAYPESVKAGSSTRDPEQDEIEAQVAVDTVSIGKYGRLSESFENLQTFEGKATGNTALEETMLFANDWVTNRSAAQNRISRLTFRSRHPDDPSAPELWAMICRAEISDLLNIRTEHPGGGGFDDSFFVEGLHYVCRPANADVHDVTLDVDVSPAAWYTSNPFDADEDPGAAP